MKSHLHLSSGSLVFHFWGPLNLELPGTLGDCTVQRMTEQFHVSAPHPWGCSGACMPFPGNQNNIFNVNFSCIAIFFFKSQHCFRVAKSRGPFRHRYELCWNQFCNPNFRCLYWGQVTASPRVPIFTSRFDFGASGDLSCKWTFNKATIVQYESYPFPWILKKQKALISLLKLVNSTSRTFYIMDAKRCHLVQATVGLYYGLFLWWWIITPLSHVFLTRRAHSSGASHSVKICPESTQCFHLWAEKQLKSFLGFHLSR